VAREATLAYFGFILELYRKLGQKPSYEYMQDIDALAEHQDDMEYMMAATPSIMVGTPDDFVEQLLDLERRGVDEVLLRVDGFGHEQHMKAIELLGREVLPLVDNGDRSVQARSALVSGAGQTR
jgi:alkanesulfonate monooxygenase SsuD/methylene tetrahydromethanopterin reductase-like flavin-dependent oxidoreductase (luciferase family)